MWKRRSEACFLLCLNLLNISKEYIYIYIFIPSQKHFMQPTKPGWRLRVAIFWRRGHFHTIPTSRVAPWASVPTWTVLDSETSRWWLGRQWNNEQTPTISGWRVATSLYEICDWVWQPWWILCILRLGRYSLDRVITVGCCRFKSPATWCTGWSFRSFFQHLRRQELMS